MFNMQYDDMQNKNKNTPDKNISLLHKDDCTDLWRSGNGSMIKPKDIFIIRKACSEEKRSGYS